MIRLVTIAVLALSGCKKPVEPAVDYRAPPQLPSPVAGTYALVPAHPKDPVVAQLVGERKWDASLAGAASGLALAMSRGDGGITPWEVREAAWRAGTPYPVLQVRGWNQGIGGPPPRPLVEWLQTVDPEHYLGIVRARSSTGEFWVALTAAPRGSVGVQPRQVPVGGSIQLPVIEGGSFVMADSDGGVQTGSTEIEQRFTLGRDGEWLFEIRDDEGTLALFPVYCGVVPPELALFESTGPTLPDADAAEEHALDLLQEVRAIYGARAWERDPMLDSAARSVLRDGTSSAHDLARRLGYDPALFARWECSAASVEGCLDKVLWKPQSRPALLGDTEVLGVAARLGPTGVHLVALIAAE